MDHLQCVCLHCSITIESARIKDFTTEVPCHGFKASSSSLAKHLQWCVSLPTYLYANKHMLKQICSFSISRFHTYARVTHVEQILWSSHCIFVYIFMCTSLFVQGLQEFYRLTNLVLAGSEIKESKAQPTDFFVFFRLKIPRLCFKLQISLKLRELFL